MTALSLEQALIYGEHITSWLEPFCERIEVVGSVRRRCQNVNDIDVLVQPKTEVQKDLLGEVISERNLVVDFVVDYVAKNAGRARIISGGKTACEIMSIELPKVQLDLFFSSASNWASRMVLRTGSKEHNIRLVQRAKSMGLEWKPSAGVLRDGRLVPAADERDIFKALGMDFVSPELRSGHD